MAQVRSFQPTLQSHPEYIHWMIAIIAIDNLNTLPFIPAKAGKPAQKYAFARIAGIVVNLFVVICSWA